MHVYSYKSAYQIFNTIDIFMIGNIISYPIEFREDGYSGRKNTRDIMIKGIFCVVHDDGYGEANSHTPTSYAARRTKVFWFNLSAAVNY